MSGTAQRAKLQSQIWKIANEVRGSVDGWEFKQFVLGTLFYRFISENFINYIKNGDESIDYASYSDEDIESLISTAEKEKLPNNIKEISIKTKGYFIYPSQLFQNVAKRASTNESLNTDLAKIFKDIENSASGYASEHDI